MKGYEGGKVKESSVFQCFEKARLGPDAGNDCKDGGCQQKPSEDAENEAMLQRRIHWWRL